ncbi:hypothetical protein YYG_02386 [Plasmodium vinckei petteri]|uniref:Heat shock protein 90, putative n=1 Tax=Plasmodium vinckei petteri TaxID=138298 RepID=W7AKZ7_PLAVN|nr:hypothetical protein YYG_02386 [Plasmodium vinckei petteri]CAD2109610.1 heat shock protein 90, putative [Plasmodium vinckei petteri]
MDKKYKSKSSVEGYSNSSDEEYKKRKKHDKKKKKKKKDRKKEKSKKHGSHKKDKDKKSKRKKKYDDSDEDIGKSNSTSATSLSFLCEGYDSLNDKMDKRGASNSIEKHKDKKKKSKRKNKEEEYKKNQESKQSEQSEKEYPEDDENENGATGDDTDSVGPKPLDINMKLANKQMDYGGAMMPGEGQAIAQFVQKGKRIPRRGEVGLSAEAIENFESLGYVMSGSRHKRMNAIRMRKENQVYSAEEQRALAMFNYEERANRENALITDLKEILRKQNETILNEEQNDT